VLGIAGFINPGNRVDVLVTIEDPATEEPVTKIVLGNLLVLASGTQIVENSKGEPAPVDVYTLEVTPEEGERITLAGSKGQLQFALRGATDAEIVLTRGVTVPELLKSMMVIVEEEKIIPTPPIAVKSKPIKKTRYTRPVKKSNKATVEIIKGLTLTKKEITI
jgi:pilus assembly protein CpaB